MQFVKKLTQKVLTIANLRCNINLRYTKVGEKKMTEFEFDVDVIALNDIARHAGDKTNTAVSKRLKMNRNTVSNVMNGRERPSSTFMFAFVSAYSLESETAGRVFFKRNLPVA